MVFSKVGLTVLFLLFGTVLAKDSNGLDFDDAEKQLKDAAKKLEDEGVMVPNLNKTVDAAKIESVLREKCEKYNAGDAVEILKTEQEVVKECISKYVNASQMQNELDIAKQSGSMDEVFAKYCGKWPNIFDCLETTTTTVKRCLSEEEGKAFNTTLNIVQEFQKFICEKDGDRLAMFVAEGGVECLQEKQEGMKSCFNSTVKDSFPLPNSDDISLNMLPMFTFDDKNCQNFDSIRSCVTDVLEGCKDSTPANIIDASLKFLKKQMPCGENAGTESTPEAVGVRTSSSFRSRSSIAFVMLGLLFLVKAS